MDYDLVVVLDADIYIEKHAPPIHTLELNNKIGIVNEVAQSSIEGYKLMVNSGFADYAQHYYKLANFDITTDAILNTGVILCNPKLHSEYLKSIYEKHIGKCVGHPRRFHYEQACIGYEIQKDQMYTLIPNTWNFIYIHHQMTKEPKNDYFLHLAGMRGSQREIALSGHTSKSVIRWGIKK
jgi:hypothetical protein